jgi:hypothetical protein
MAPYYDDNGNLIGESINVPVVPEQSNREVSVEVKDGDTTNKLKVNPDGSINIRIVGSIDGGTF